MDIFFTSGGWFGTEFIMNVHFTTYFSGNRMLEAISLAGERAGLTASLYELKNPRARAFGSDFFNERWVIRERLSSLDTVQFVERISSLESRAPCSRPHRCSSDFFLFLRTDGERCHSRYRSR